MKLDIEQPEEFFRTLWMDQGYKLTYAPRADEDAQLSTFTVDVCDGCKNLVLPRPFSKPGSYRLFAYCPTCHLATEI